MEKTKKDHLKELNRLLVWPTLVLFIVFTVSGYGILNPGTVSGLTGGLFTRAFSLYLHTTLTLPTLALVMIHVLIAVRLVLIRWGVREGNLLNTFLVLLGTLTIVLLVLMQYMVS